MHMTFEPYVYTTSSGLPEQMKINFQLLALTKSDNFMCYGCFKDKFSISVIQSTMLITSALLLYLYHKQVLSETWNKYVCL